MPRTIDNCIAEAKQYCKNINISEQNIVHDADSAYVIEETGCTSEAQFYIKNG